MIGAWFTQRYGPRYVFQFASICRFGFLGIPLRLVAIFDGVSKRSRSSPGRGPRPRLIAWIPGCRSQQIFQGTQLTWRVNESELKGISWESWDNHMLYVTIVYPIVLLGYLTYLTQCDIQEIKSWETHDQPYNGFRVLP